MQGLSHSVGIANNHSGGAELHCLYAMLHSMTDLLEDAELCYVFLQIGMSDKSILRDFHPDAEDLYNVTMDLSTVCKELKDRNKRMPRRVMTSLCLT